MGFKLQHFDFTANEFSRSFEPHVKLTEAFAKQFRDYLKGKRKGSLTPTDLDRSQIAGDVDELTSMIVSSALSPVSPELRPMATKRPAPVPMSLPEVEPPPVCVKRPKSKPTETKQTSDGEFKTAVETNYLLREGMLLVTIWCLIRLLCILVLPVTALSLTLWIGV